MILKRYCRLQRGFVMFDTKGGPRVLLNVEDKLSMITIVGEAAGPSVGLIGRILSAVAEAGVNLSTVNQGAGALNLIIGVGEDDYEKTINAIYQIL